jgi:hypothetical protein
MENQWNNPRIREVVELLLQRPNVVEELQPRSFNLHPDEYALAYYLSKEIRSIAQQVIATNYPGDRATIAVHDDESGHIGDL